MWSIQSFAADSDDLLAEFDLDALAGDAVERLIGSRPSVLTPDQIREIAPLFDVHADQWDGVAGPLVDVSPLGQRWMDKALAHLVAKAVVQSTDDLGRGDHLIPQEKAQWLVARFSAGTLVPEGEVFVGFCTTPDVKFWRSPLRTWPSFHDADLPDELEALSFKKWRYRDQDVNAAVTTASDALRVAAQRAGVTEGVRLWLVGSGFAESVRLDPADLVFALRITRVHDAVVVATPDAPDPRSLLIPSTPPSIDRPVPCLAAPAVTALADGALVFAARATGAREDNEVGPDLFARTPLLDRVEAALQTDRPR